MFKVISLFLVLISFSLFAAPTYADHHDENEMGRGRMLKEVMEQLSLTDEQKNKMKENRKNSRESGKKLRGNLKAKRKAIQEALKSDANVDQLQAKHKEVQAARNAMDDFRFQQQMFVRSILTKEQRQKFVSIMEEKRGAWKKRAKGKHKRMRKAQGN